MFVFKIKYCAYRLKQIKKLSIHELPLHRSTYNIVLFSHNIKCFFSHYLTPRQELDHRPPVHRKFDDNYNIVVHFLFNYNTFIFMFINFSSQGTKPLIGIYPVKKYIIRKLARSACKQNGSINKRTRIIWVVSIDIKDKIEFKFDKDVLVKVHKCHMLCCT